MKKFLCLMFAFMVSITLFLSGCNKSDKNTIRLVEVTHSIFYAPLYIAINNGYFEDEGLTIKLTNGGGADKCMTAILSKNADIGLMGPEAAIYVKAGDAKDYAVVFGQLTKRDGSFLVSKTPTDNFSWNDLKGKTVIGGREGGVPALTFDYVMKQNGLNPGNQIDATHDVKVLSNVEFNLTAATFENDDSIDYCTLFEPIASQVVARGTGHVVASIGEYSGEIPYTAFMAKKSYLTKDPKRAEKFLRAIKRGYDFLVKENNLENAVDSIMPSFADTDRNVIKEALKRYIAIDAWVETPVMKQESYNKLHSLIKDANLIDKDVEYSSIIDNTYALKLA